MDSFFVIDIETANYWFESICQIGLVEFTDNELVTRIDELINPEDDFDEFNEYIHGISPKDVQAAKTFPEIYPVLSEMVSGRILASYGGFDKTSLLQACERYKLPELKCDWLNLQSVVRRAWSEEYKQSGWKLKKVCKFLNIKLTRHHNAIDDATTACEIFIKAIQESGISADEWLKRVKKPIDFIEYDQIEVNVDGDLYGESIVFTGALTIARKDAEKIAASLGCHPQAGVNKKTTILVVGDQDLQKLNGKEKSSKHLKAENLISEGQDIRIISESDFNYMVNKH